MSKKPFHWTIFPLIYRTVMGERNSELEQASIRVLIGMAALFYFSKIEFPQELEKVGLHLDPIVVLFGFVVTGVSVAFWVSFRPGDNPSRRILSIFIDTGTLTYLFIIAESRAAPLFFLYQWIIIGYGFRFGVRYLFISLGMVLLGFGVVIFMVPYWSDEFGLSLGLWIGTMLISLYFSTLISRLYNALDHAEEANQAKRKFICSVSHELRTPLNAIIGMVDLLKSTLLDREQREILSSMTNTSKVMLSQIEDVLDFSKIEAGKMSVEKISFDLYQLVQGILDIFSYQIDPFQIELSHSIDCNVPYALEGDPHHLRQILVNLIGNAVKFTEQGRISLRIIKIHSAMQSVRLRFLIRDTGIGITEAAKDRIFESFTQADESTARRFGGTGLGTTICKQLVELMHGSIGFESIQGEGSAFWFELEFAFCESSARAADIDSFGVIRSLIISSNEEYESLVDRLIDFCGMTPALAKNMSAAANSMEQAVLAGMPMRLVFMDEPRQAEETLSSYVARIRHNVDLLRKTAPQGKVTAILLAGQSNSNQPLDELMDEVMDVAGIYSLLHLPADRNDVKNLLHAHLIELNRSKSNFTSADHIDSASLRSVPVMTSQECSGYEILVAEDNATNRKVMQKILERAGHRCTLVKDGDEALDAVDKKVFDAIVLDMNMPLMAGTDVARLCRLMQGQSSRIPIIMFSANVTPEARQESIEAGADEFLPKPIQVDIFLKTLDRLIDGSHLKNPDLRRRLPSVSLHPMLMSDDEPVLDFQSLEHIGQMSKDLKFLDDLIIEFISDNKKMLSKLEVSMLNKDHESFREIIHSLKGSALSIGAVAMKMACRRLEKLNPSVLDMYSNEIIRQMTQIFMLLCEELERYRKNRLLRNTKQPNEDAGPRLAPG